MLDENQLSLFDSLIPLFYKSVLPTNYIVQDVSELNGQTKNLSLGPKTRK